MAIQGFKDERCEAIFNRRHPGKRFPADLIRVTFRKLRLLHAAAVLADLRARPRPTTLRPWLAIAPVSIRSASTTSFVSVSSGRPPARWTSNSSIITRR